MHDKLFEANNFLFKEEKKSCNLVSNIEDSEYERSTLRSRGQVEAGTWKDYQNLS